VTTVKGYPYALVKNAPMKGDIVRTILPPETTQGAIVGKDAWVKSWEAVKVG